MFDSNLVRIFLGLYTVFALIALFLLWRNSAAPDALKNTGVMVASLLPVLIAVFPYLKQEKIERYFNYALLYDSTDKTIVTGDMKNPYDMSYIKMFTNLNAYPNALKADSFSEFMGSKGFDIIEKGIIEALLSKYMMHWDIEPKKFQGPVGQSESWSHNSKLGNKIIKLSDLKQIFRHNPLISQPGVLVTSQISLPPDCTIQIQNEMHSRIITFDNSFVTLKITIVSTHGGVVQHGVWGVLLPDEKNMNRYYAIEYNIASTLYVKKTKTHAPEMEYYKRWFENTCDVLAKYNWNTVDEQIEKNLTRKAISEIAEIKETITKQSGVSKSNN